VLPAKAALAVGGVFWALLGVYLPCQGLLVLLVLAAAADSCPVRDTCSSTPHTKDHAKTPKTHGEKHTSPSGPVKEATCCMAFC
jgi:hypothetical protein